LGGPSNTLCYGQNGTTRFAIGNMTPRGKRDKGGSIREKSVNGNGYLESVVEPNSALVGEKNAARMSLPSDKGDRLNRGSVNSSSWGETTAKTKRTQ